MRYVPYLMTLCCIGMCYFVLAIMLKQYGINGIEGINPDAFSSTATNFVPAATEKDDAMPFAARAFFLLAFAAPVVGIAVHHFWLRK